MGYARKNLVSLRDTPYYHCIARCVRRAWLWGMDEYACKDYSHRKEWVIERLAHLANIFSVEICAYAVMSNHYHLVLYENRDRARKWSQQTVVDHWEQLFRLPPPVHRWRSGAASQAETELAERIIEGWRARLLDISWFMRCLNEYLARRANAEDRCTGRFWEGRFRSQALLDEAGLLTAMAYVDLNPIRAGIASTPEYSEFTSIYDRIRALRNSVSPRKPESCAGIPLRSFKAAGARAGRSIPFALEEYLQLVDWTGRVVRHDRRRSIDPSLPSILHRLAVDPESWERAMRNERSVFGRALGRLDLLRLHATTLGQQWIRSLRASQRLYR
jgi:REP element-mobilizing transposase RayT